MKCLTIIFTLLLSATTIFAQDDTPVEVIDAQLQAYNDRDIEAFAATYTEDVECYEYGQPYPFVRGIEELKKSYGTMFQTSPDLYAKSTNRIVQGNKVIEHEIAEGINGLAAIQVVVIYELEGALIKKVTFMY